MFVGSGGQPTLKTARMQGHSKSLRNIRPSLETCPPTEETRFTRSLSWDDARVETQSHERYTLLNLWWLYNLFGISYTDFLFTCSDCIVSNSKWSFQQGCWRSFPSLVFHRLWETAHNVSFIGLEQAEQTLSAGSSFCWHWARSTFFVGKDLPADSREVCIHLTLEKLSSCNFDSRTNL